MIDGWNQHLDELNRKRSFSQKFAAQLIRMEAPYSPGTLHVGHVHPYWQLEIVKEGGFSICLSEKIEMFPKPGDILVIPPQNWHHFRNISGNGAWALKFTVSEMDDFYPVSVISACEETAILHRTILDQAEWLQKNPGDIGVNIMEHMISAVLDIYSAEFVQKINMKEHATVKAVKRFIEDSHAACRPVKVSEISSWKKCSSVYLNRIFKRSMGIPLKVFIDQSCFETAKKLLLESGLSITEISDEMGFPDLFSFSRFFKRMGGLSPAKFRKECSCSMKTELTRLS